MRLNIKHKRNLERDWQRARREFASHLRPATADDLAGGAVGCIKGVHMVVTDPMQFMDKRQRRKWRRRERVRNARAL